ARRLVDDMGIPNLLEHRAGLSGGFCHGGEGLLYRLKYEGTNVRLEKRKVMLRASFGVERANEYRLSIPGCWAGRIAPRINYKSLFTARIKTAARPIPARAHRTELRRGKVRASTPYGPNGRIDRILAARREFKRPDGGAEAKPGDESLRRKSSSRQP